MLPPGFRTVLRGVPRTCRGGRGGRRVEAVELALRLLPDLGADDVRMPRLDGVGRHPRDRPRGRNCRTRS